MFVHILPPGDQGGHEGDLQGLPGEQRQIPGEYREVHRQVSAERIWANMNIYSYCLTRDLPVVNLRGEVLFKAWRDIFQDNRLILLREAKSKWIVCFDPMSTLESLSFLKKEYCTASTGKMSSTAHDGKSERWKIEELIFSSPGRSSPTGTGRARCGVCQTWAPCLPRALVTSGGQW